jgi:hypothetical protein
VEGLRMRWLHERAHRRPRLSLPRRAARVDATSASTCRCRRTPRAAGGWPCAWCRTASSGSARPLLEHRPGEPPPPPAERSSGHSLRPVEARDLEQPGLRRRHGRAALEPRARPAAFDWGNGGPSACGTGRRLRGALQPAGEPARLRHHLRTTTDDGVRLWVDGVLVIDRVADGPGPATPPRSPSGRLARSAHGLLRPPVRRTPA